MDFLQTLGAQVGGLLRIKSELYWYGGRVWDGTPGRICLLLDAVPIDPLRLHADAIVSRFGGGAATDAVLLLIDGAPHWVWVCQEDVEIL